MENLNEKVAKLEVRVKGHEKRIQNLENNNEAITRMATLMEILSESYKKQQEQLSEQHLTLVKMNESLDGMKEELKEVSKRVSQVEYHQSESQILGKKGRQILFTVIPSVISGVILTYLLIKLNLK